MAESKIFKIPATFDGFTPHKDGGASIRFGTNELADTDWVVIKQFLGQFGQVLFKANDFVDEDIPRANAERDTLSPSLRLRNVLFVYWKQQQKAGKSVNLAFEAFYERQYERFIESVKAKLEPHDA